MHLLLLVTKKNQQEPCLAENCFIQLSEKSVESLLSSASLTLRELEIPREKLLPDTLQLIKLGAYGSIYRAQLETGSSGKTKTVVLKALQGKAHGQDPLWCSLCTPDINTGQNQDVFSVISQRCSCRNALVRLKIADHADFSCQTCSLLLLFVVVLFLICFILFFQTRLVHRK